MMRGLGVWIFVLRGGDRTGPYCGLLVTPLFALLSVTCPTLGNVDERLRFFWCFYEALPMKVIMVSSILSILSSTLPIAAKDFSTF